MEISNDICTICSGRDIVVDTTDGKFCAGCISELTELKEKADNHDGDICNLEEEIQNLKELLNERD